MFNFVTFLNKKSTVYNLCKTYPHQTSQQSNILKTRGTAVPQLPSGVGSVVDLRVARHADVATGCSTCKHFIVELRVIQNVWAADNYRINTFAASYLNTQGLNNSCLKSPASTLVDLTFQSRALRSFSLNQLMLRGRVGCLRQPTLPLSIRINTGSLYRNVRILNYKRDKDNVS